MLCVAAVFAAFGDFLTLPMLACVVAAILLLPIVAVIALVLIFAACVFVLPQEFGRNLVWFGLRCVYRIRVHGAENIPRDRGALLVANHVSWLDGVLMLLLSVRRVRMMVFAGNFAHPLMKRAGERWKVIAIHPGPKSILKSLKTAREEIQSGSLVGIFPEGGITRNSLLQTFKPGLMRIVQKSNATVVPIYIDGLWGSIFSFEGGKFFYKLPRKWRTTINIHIGQPLEDVQSLHSVRQAVQLLGAHAVNQRLHRPTRLPESMIEACKKRKFASKIADSAGNDVKGGEVLMRSLILRRLLRREVLGTDEPNVGVLLPPSTGGVITNMALALDRRIAVNLNYTVSSSIMNQCIKQAGIKHVLTSQRVIEKLDLDIDAEVVLLEDLRSKLKTSDKIAGALGAYVTPTAVLSSMLGLGNNKPDDVLTLIFTSGSTGSPKGVMLTHANVRSNVDAIRDVIRLEPRDSIVGILPFFHSFGYTVTLWTVMALDIKGLYHFNPLDARQVGKLVKKHQGTILLSTPTFLRSYLRRCTPEDFASLDTVVAGAEKLPKELCDAYEAKFGIRPVEGYGTTELSPLVSVNVPPSRRPKDAQQVDLREGSVGRPIPGVAAKIIDANGEEQPTNESGMLLISGPNVMKGYLNQPEKTKEVIKDGWYVTGDIAYVDDDGFIIITGRESRFSKIGGEMVPHLQVEECLMELVGSSPDDDQDDDEASLKIAVTSVPDAKKGERLIVLHTRLSKPVDELIDGLRKKGLPNLYIPSADSFHQVDHIPVLGTGKLDLKALKDTATGAFCEGSS